MPKKLKRLFRNRFLTADEIAADEELRNKTEQEFPPKIFSGSGQADLLSELLRQAIRESGRTIEELAGAVGLPPKLIASFLDGKRDIHLATADRLARSLGLEVTT